MSSIAQAARFLAELQVHRFSRAKSQIEPPIRPKCSQSIDVGWFHHLSGTRNPSCRDRGCVDEVWGRFSLRLA